MTVKIIDVPISDLVISDYNPRQIREPEYIDRLADRMTRNGFEVTRALWVSEISHNKYEIFAGGTRFQAAKKAGLSKVPVVLYKDLSEYDIVRLATEDNENDEYHQPVNLVDVWTSYARLSGLGWTQEKIAEAHGVSQQLVSRRLSLHRLPDKIKHFTTQGKLTERHLAEIVKLLLGSNFSEWLTTEQAQLELCKEAVKRKWSVRDTKAKVKAFQAVLDAAQDAYQKLKDQQEKFEAAHAVGWPAKRCNLFINQLVSKKARTKAAVSEAYNHQLHRYLQAVQEYEMELARQRDEAEAERLRLEQEAKKAALIEDVLKHLYHGDFREVCKSLPPASVDVIITDPPYPEKYLPLYEDLAIAAERLLKPGGSLLVMCGQSYLPEIFRLMDDVLNYQWTFSYQTPGGQSPQIWQAKVNTFWKPILWYVKGKYIGDWHGDVIKSDVNDNDKRYHKWGQSESGISRLTEEFTQLNDVVLDPFVGGGTTGLVALSMSRKFIGIDIDLNVVDSAKDRIFEYLKDAQSIQARRQIEKKLLSDSQ